MSEPNDELLEIWKSGSDSPSVNVEEVLGRMQEKSVGFGRTIRGRDLRETIAGLFIAVLFGWFAYGAGDWLTRAADLWIAAAGLWIVYWLQRHSCVLMEPPRDQSVGGYYRALSDSYDRQVWLLRTAKLWYVLPIWSGLMLYSFANWRMTHNNTVLAVLVATFTLVFGFVWWLNEWWGVRYLRGKQAELEKLLSNSEAGAR